MILVRRKNDGTGRTFIEDFLDDLFFERALRGDGGAILPVAGGVEGLAEEADLGAEEGFFEAGYGVWGGHAGGYGIELGGLHGGRVEVGFETD